MIKNSAAGFDLYDTLTGTFSGVGFVRQKGLICVKLGLSIRISASGSPRRVPPPYTLRLTIRTKKTGATTIEIEDNGPGIPDEIKDKILQPFFTTKKGTQGTDLGLSITNDIVKTHGGFMEIKSDENGTTMMIKLNKQE